jgi:hypothetical protein
MRAYHLGLKVRCFLILVQWIKAYVPCERRVYTGLKFQITRSGSQAGQHHKYVPKYGGVSKNTVFLEIKASQIATAHRIGLLYSLVVE